MYLIFSYNISSFSFMDESSYSPSELSLEQIVECSQVSLRSVGSQMSISSAGSGPKVTITKKRKHKVFCSKGQRIKMAKCRTVRKLKFPKVSETIITPKASHSILHSNTDSYIVVSLVAFKEVLDSMAKCLVCNGRLELLATGTSSGCASYLNLKCSMGDSEKKFWSGATIPIVKFK